MFSEGLAEYSALTVMEKRYGREATQKFLRRELDGYLRGRGIERKKEVPFLYVENQPYIHYQKGSLVFYALRDYIGEEAMNRGLQQLPGEVGVQGTAVSRRRGISTPSWIAVTPDSLKYVLTRPVRGDHVLRQQGGQRHVHQAARRQVRRAPGGAGEEAQGRFTGRHARRPDGRLRGRRHLRGACRRAEAGRAAAGAEGADHRAGDDPRSRGGQGAAKAGIDPYNKLIDRTPEDNVTAVQ